MKNFLRSIVSIKSFSAAFFLLFSICLFQSCDNNKNQTDSPEVTQYSKNIDELSEAIRQSPDEAEPYYLRAQALFDETQYDAAIADAKKAISLDSFQMKYWQLLSDTYLNYQRPSLALEVLQSAVRVFPEDIPTKLKLSQLYVVLERYGEADYQLKKALEIDPQNANSFYLYGISLQSQGKKQEAIDAYLKSAEIEPENADVWMSVGNLLDETADPRAEQYFRNAIGVDSNNLEAWLSLGNHHYTMGRLEKALGTYAKIIEKDKQFSNAHLNAGLVYMDMEDFENAKENFNRAVITAPTNANAYYFRGLASEKLGLLEKASIDYSNTLNLQSDHERAKEGLIRLGFAAKAD